MMEDVLEADKNAATRVAASENLSRSELAAMSSGLRSEIKQLTASVEQGQLVKDMEKGKADMKKWQE